MSEEFVEGRDRVGDIASRPLDPGCLVGSYYHLLDSDKYVEQGLVVAEVQPGIYLLEVFDWFTGDPLYQHPVSLDRMARNNEDDEYRFYDTREKMKHALQRADARTYPGRELIEETSKHEV